MITRLILFAAYLFEIVCFYFSYSFDWSAKETKPLMVSIPKYAQKDEAMLSILFNYRKKIRYFLLFMSALGLLIFFCPFSISIILILFMIFPCLMIPPLFGKKAREALLLLKEQNSWSATDTPSYHIDLSLHQKSVHKSLLPWPVFLIPIALHSFIIYHSFTHPGWIWLFAPISAFHLLFLIIGYVYLRLPPNKIYCDDSSKNQMLNGCRKYNYSLALLLLISSDALFYLSLLPTLSGNGKGSFSLLLLGSLLALVLVLTACHYISNFRRTCTKALQNVTLYTYNEDDYWKFGLFGLYYDNPYDPSVFKSNNSGGLNLNLNRAKPSSKVFWCAALGIPLLICALTFGYPWYLDTTHTLVDIAIQEESIKIESKLYRKSISLSSIDKIEMTKNLGSGSKTSGTSTFHYGTGTYQYAKYGKIRAYVAWKHPPYLLVYAEGITYLINDDDPENTQKLYEQINTYLNSDKKAKNEDIPQL